MDDNITTKKSMLPERQPYVNLVPAVQQESVTVLSSLPSRPSRMGDVNNAGPVITIDTSRQSLVSTNQAERLDCQTTPVMENRTVQSVQRSKSYSIDHPTTITVINRDNCPTRNDVETRTDIPVGTQQQDDNTNRSNNSVLRRHQSATAVTNNLPSVNRSRRNDVDNSTTYRSLSDNCPAVPVSNSNEGNKQQYTIQTTGTYPAMPIAHPQSNITPNSFQSRKPIIIPAEAFQKLDSSGGSAIPQDVPVKPPLSRHPSNERQLLPVNTRTNHTQQSSPSLQPRTGVPMIDSSMIPPGNTNPVLPQVASQQHRSHPPSNMNPNSAIPTNAMIHQQQQQQQQQYQGQIQSNPEPPVPTNLPEPQKRKSRFVLLGQNGNPSLVIPHSTDNLSQQGQQQNFNSQQMQAPKMSTPQDDPTSAYAQRPQHPHPDQWSGGSFLVPEMTFQQPHTSQYILVTGFPQHSNTNPPPAIYHVMAPPNMNHNVISSQSAFGMQNPPERHYRAASEGGMERPPPVMVLQPMSGRHSRPRSDGGLDTGDVYHDQRQTIAQAAEQYSYANIVQSQNQSNYGPSSTTSGDVSPSPQGSKTPANSQQYGANNNADSNQYTQQPILPHKVQSSSQSIASTNSVSSQITGDIVPVPSQVVRLAETDGGTVKMTKGRFRVLDSGVVPTQQHPSVQDCHTETNVTDPTPATTPAPVGPIHPSVAGSTSQGNPTNPVIKIGRFVVTNVSETSQPYSMTASNVQSAGLVNNPTTSSVPMQEREVRPGPIKSSGQTLVEVPDTNHLINISNDGEGKNQLDASAQSTVVIDTQSIARPLPSQSRTVSSAENSLSAEANSSQKMQIQQAKEGETERVKSERQGPQESNAVRAPPAPQPADHVSQESASTRLNVTSVYPRTTRNILDGPNVGLGKVMHNLSMMQTEMNELDRYHRSLQTENRCLKEKNKELEAKARDWERKFYSEKTSREKAEQKVKELNAKLQAMKESSEASKEEGSTSATVSNRKGAGSGVSEGEETPGIESAKVNGAVSATKTNTPELPMQGADIDKEGSLKSSPLCTRELKKPTASDPNQLSPSRDQAGKNIPLQKPPILPYQKKTGTSTKSQTSVTPQSYTQRKTVEVRNQSSSTNQQISVDPPFASNQSSPTASVQAVSVSSVIDSINNHSALFPPKPLHVSNSRGENMSSASMTFDPLAQVGTNESMTAEGDFDSQGGPPCEPLPSSLPGFIVTPVSVQSPDLLSFPVDSWIHTTKSTSESQANSAEYDDQQQAMFLIHQPIEMQTWPTLGTSQLYSDINQIPIMTYSAQTNGHYRQPSISDFNGSQDHYRNTSAGQIPYVNQSWTSSPSHQESYNPSQPDLLSSDDLTIPLTDYTSSEYLQSERELLLPNSFTPVPGEDVSMGYDPFDVIAHRKSQSDEF